MITKIKQYGWKNGFVRLLKLLLRLCSIKTESYIFYVQEINTSLIDRISINPNYTIKDLNYHDYKNSSGLKFDYVKLELFKKRFDFGTYKAYGVYHGDKLIYSSWISLTTLEFSINTLGLSLDSNEGLLLDIVTHPEYRRQGLHNYMNIYCLDRIKEYGKDKAIVLVLKENTPARKSQERSGFKKCKIIENYRIWGIERIRIKAFND